MLQHKNQKSNSKIRRFVLPIAILLVIGAAVLVAFRFNSHQQTNDRPAPTNTVNYDKPTAQEQEAGDKQKETNIERQEQDKATPSTTANVVLVDAGVYGDDFEVRAYVSNLLEDGGSCTVTLTGTTTITRSSQSFKDATTTQCGQLVIPAKDIPAGDYTVRVAYQSSTATGTSSAKSVKVE